jgi:hypothetical protein
VHINVDGDKIDLVTPEADEWVERIGMTAYEMYNYNRIQFEASGLGWHAAFNIE